MDIKLVIGLGNPDPEYQNTYHNIGHIAVDYFSEKLKVESEKFRKSDFYMNQSGKFVKASLKKYEVKPENLLIIHDDADIELGRYKFSFGRGSAGHKGVENVIDALRTKNFWRLRMGIRPHSALRASRGRPKRNKVKADELVLKKISAAHRKIITSILKSIEKQLDLRLH